MPTAPKTKAAATAPMAAIRFLREDTHSIHCARLICRIRELRFFALCSASPANSVSFAVSAAIVRARVTRLWSRAGSLPVRASLSMLRISASQRDAAVEPRDDDAQKPEPGIQFRLAGTADVLEALAHSVEGEGWVLRKRDDIAIEKSADQMDEVQYASERDLAIRNVDRDSALLRDVKAALGRIHDETFGTCIECESPISPKRLAAVPWAPRCIQCQEAADRNGLGITDMSEILVRVA
jgi:DnaK suppressor protein